MTPEISTLVIDAPLPDGPQRAAVFTFDGHGCELGWFSVDEAGNGRGPHSEHPERSFFGWPEGISMPVSFYNDVEEGWACPSYEAALEAALYEHAERLDSDWFDPSECDVEVPLATR